MSGGPENESDTHSIMDYSVPRPGTGDTETKVLCRPYPDGGRSEAVLVRKDTTKVIKHVQCGDIRIPSRGFPISPVKRGGALNMMKMLAPEQPVTRRPLIQGTLLFAGMLCGFSTTAKALDIFARSDARHGRLISNSNDLNTRFLFYEYNPSGIAVNQDTLANAGRVAMVTTRHFMTAHHTSGTHPNTVTFLTQSGEFREYAVAGYTRVGDTDIAVGELVLDIPPEDGIAIYTVPEVADGEIGATLGVFGMQQLAAVNRLLDHSAIGVSFHSHFSNGTNLVRGGDQAYATMGDSGHALVAAYEGRLFLMGVHWYPTLSSSIPRAIDPINDILALDGMALTTVPRLPRTIAWFSPGATEGLWSDAGVHGGTLATDPDAPAGGGGFHVDFEAENPLIGGSLSSLHAVSGNRSLYLGTGQSARLEIPEVFQGGDFVVHFRTLDLGKWIDPDVAGSPNRQSGPRWGLSTGSHSEAETLGLALGHWSYLNSDIGYVQLNGTTRFGGSFFSPIYLSGINRTDLLSEDGGSNPSGTEWIPGSEADSPTWIEWTFAVSAGGTVTLSSPRFPHIQLTKDIGASPTELWFYGGRSVGGRDALSGVYIDDIDIARPVASSSVGRIASTRSPHDLYAPNSSRRPRLVNVVPDGSLRALAFDGSGQLVSTDARLVADNAPRVFQFELKTRRPRFTLAIKPEARPAGSSTLLDLTYRSGQDRLHLWVDHANNRLIADGFGQSLELPITEDRWSVIEFAREDDLLSLQLNGGAPVTRDLTQAPANPDFDALSVGANLDGSDGFTGLLGELHISDTGTLPEPGVQNAFLETHPTRLIEEWRIEHFGTMANAGMAADNFDANGNGLVNIGEYVLGGNPTSPGHPPSPRMSFDESGRPGLRFERVADPNFTYQVWSSEDLEDWGAAPFWESTGMDNQSGPILVKPSEASSPRLFLKLSIRANE